MARSRGVWLGNPNGAAALRRAGKGGAPLRAAIARNADRHARDLAPVVADIRAGGATSLRTIAAELNARGMLTRRRALARLHGDEPTRPARAQDDNALSYNVAKAEIDAGADIIFTMLNAGRAGAIDAMREAGVKQIGNVRDWYPDAPDVFVASAVANVSIPSLVAARDLANGTWEPGKVVQIGLENPEAVSLALSPKVPGEVVEQLEALRDKIVSGEIEVSTEFEGEESSSDATGAASVAPEPRAGDDDPNSETSARTLRWRQCRVTVLSVQNQHHRGKS